MNKKLYAVAGLLVFALMPIPAGAAAKPQIYILASPPTSQIGLVLGGKYYWFGREPTEVKCDLRYEGACYWKSNVKVKQVTKAIISINNGKAFGCSRSIIPDMSI